MSFSPNQKSAPVTGSTRGIGEAIAIARADARDVLLASAGKGGYL